jgi:hypothetical protein
MSSRLSKLPDYPLTVAIPLALVVWTIWRSPNVPWLVLCVGGGAGVVVGALNLSLLKGDRSGVPALTTPPPDDLRTSRGRRQLAVEMLGVMLVLAATILTVPRGTPFLFALGAGAAVMLLVQSVVLLSERRRQWLASQRSTEPAI